MADSSIPPARKPSALGRLRSRAEQIADELAEQNLDPDPTVRRLPSYDPPAKPRVPDR